MFAASNLYLGETAESFQIAGIDGALILISVAAATTGLVFGIWLFGAFRNGGHPRMVERIASANRGTQFLYRASLNKWWFDDLNHLLFIVLGGRVAAGMWWFDRVVIDGTVNGIGGATRGVGGSLRRIQTGRVQNYALGIAIGLLVMAGSFLVIVSQPR